MTGTDGGVFGEDEDSRRVARRRWFIPQAVGKKMGLVWVWGKRFVCLTALLQVDGPVYLTRFGTVSEYGSVCML